METFFQEMKRYVGFGDAEAAAIRAAAPALARRIDGVVAAFYERVLAHEGARRVLGDESQVERLKGSLRSWLAQLLGGPYDEAYFALRARVGRAHVRVGLPQRYMPVAMEVVRAELIADADPAVAAALHKLLAVELAATLETYREDSDARIVRAERARQEALAERLGEAERRYRDIVEGTEALVVVLDAERRIRFMNRKAEETCGAALAQVEGRDWVEEFVPPDWRDRVRETIARRTREADSRSAERPLLTHGGEVRWIQWLPTRPAAGARTLFAVGIDVTERRALEQRVARSERLAAAGTLAAGLAHEIRNPLNAALLQLTVLERKLHKADAAVAAGAAPTLETVRGEIKRLSGLVSEFLEFARPRQLDLARRDVGEIVRDVARLVEPDAAAAGVRVHADVPPAVPDASLDAERMRQVLLNLVRNGVEAMPDGGDLTLRVRNATRAVEIDVEDTGLGFDADEPIFDAFYTTKDAGTGLGLAIVHRIVGEHGGEVRAESRPGRTVFTVSLPTT